MSALQALKEGILMGAGSEAEAAQELAVRKAEAYLTSKIDESNYQDILREKEKYYKGYREENPVLAPVLEAVGGTIPTIGAFFAPVPGGRVVAAANAARQVSGLRQALNALMGGRYRRAATTGGFSGGLTGYNTAEESRREDGTYTDRDRVGTAMYTAPFGMAFGPLGTAAVRGLGKVGKNVVDRFRNPEGDVITDKAATIIKERLDEDNLTIQDAQKIISNTRKPLEEGGYGVPITLADTGDNILDLTQNIGQRSGKAANIILSQRKEAQKGGRDRVRNIIEKKLGTRSRDEIEFDTKGERGILADKSYKLAFQDGEAINDPQLITYVNKQLKEFIPGAKNLQNRATNRQDLSGDVENIPPLRIDIDEEGVVTGLNVRAIDAIKKAMDKKINTAKTTDQGEYVELIKDKQAFLKRVDDLDASKYGDGVSLYQKARREFSDASSRLDALENGAKDFSNNKISPFQVQKNIENLSGVDRDAYVLGSADSLINKFLDQPDTNKNFARFIRSPNIEEKLKILVGGDSDNFKLMKNALLAEAEFFEKTGNLIRQSATFKLQQGGKGLDEALADGASDAIEGAVTNMSLTRILPNAIKLVSNSAVPGTVKVRIAELLTGTPEEVATAIKSIDKIVSSKTGREIRGEKLLSQGTREANKALIREVQSTQKFDQTED